MKKDKEKEIKQTIKERCELFGFVFVHDKFQELFFILKKYPDGSVLHTKETQLFQSRELTEVLDFINKPMLTPFDKVMIRIALKECYGLTDSLKGKNQADAIDALVTQTGMRKSFIEKHIQEILNINSDEKSNENK
jgi:hypothetical protein